MANPINGRNAYAYVGGVAVVHLTGWTFSLTDSATQLDPDIGSDWIYVAEGFKSGRGTVNLNLTSDDFASMFDKTVAGAEVGLYLYSETGSSKWYLYGQARLVDMNMTVELQSTVKGPVGFQTSGTWGRQTTAA